VRRCDPRPRRYAEISDESYSTYSFKQTSNGGNFSQMFRFAWNFPMIYRKKRRHLEDEAKAAAEVTLYGCALFLCFVETQRIFGISPIHIAYRKYRNTANQGRLNYDLFDLPALWYPENIEVPQRLFPDRAYRLRYVCVGGLCRPATQRDIF